MKDVVILGAGGCAREVAQWIKAINEERPRWRLKGFIDNDLTALEGKKCDVCIISNDDYIIGSNDVFVCAIGSNAVRQRVMAAYQSRGAEFINVIHPTAVIADNCSLGTGVIVYPHSVISDNTHIGDGCIINSHTSIGHDSVLGTCCTISAHCDITGNCRLGDRVFMGTTSQMVPGSRIGHDAYICAGSTVMTRVRDGTKVMGNPARIIQF